MENHAKKEDYVQMAEREPVSGEMETPESTSPSSQFVTFLKDGSLLRCMDYLPTLPLGSKGKAIYADEKDAWRVTRKLTEKERRKHSYNPDYPLGPYECEGALRKYGIRHYHIGHGAENVGRKIPAIIRLQLRLDVTGKTLEKGRRTVRYRVRYWFWRLIR